MDLDADYTRTLRAEFRHYADEIAQGSFPLKKILMVGARLNDPANARHLNSADRQWLSSALLALRQHKIPYDPDLDVSVVNIEPDQGGEDFLKGEYKADLVVFCYVFNPPDRPYFKNNADGFFSISNDHHKDKIWHDQTVKTGARAAFVVGGHTEINDSHIRNGWAEAAGKPHFKLIENEIDFSLLCRNDYGPGIRAIAAYEAEHEKRWAEMSSRYDSAAYKFG